MKQRFNQFLSQKNQVLILLFSFLLNVSFAQTVSVDKQSWKELNFEGFSIDYPENWDVNMKGEMGTKFILFSPLENNQDDFKENINLVVQDLTGYDIDLNGFVEISEQQVSTYVTEGKILESNRLSKENIAYHKMIYTGKQGVYKLKFEQYFWVIESKAYILTFTSEESNYQKYKMIAETILNSFSF